MSEAGEAARNFDPRTPIERLLEAALAPIDPPAGFVDELETKLTVVQTAAIEALEEMSDWELAAMRDPRNWVRPAVAIVAGTAAGTALVLLQVRRGRVDPRPDPVAGSPPSILQDPSAGHAFCYVCAVDDERRPSSKSQRTYPCPLDVDSRLRKGPGLLPSSCGRGH